jgi:c-di-GMP-binding flagellar brake protein YcgR
LIRQIDAKGAAMIELRQYERVGFLCKLELTAIPGGKPQPARSLDLSLGGVGVVTQSVYPIGQLLTVTFFLGDSICGEIQDPVVGRIVHFAADVDANRVGIHFLQPLTETEHRKLVNRLVNV